VIEERNRLRPEHKRGIRATVQEGEDRPSYRRRFADNARSFYALHGKGKELCFMGDALVSNALIPYNNKKGIRELRWTKIEMNSFMKKYNDDVDYLKISDFGLSHPLDEEPMNILERLEISDQPFLQLITSTFCGDRLKSFIATNCDLTSLPAEAFKKCKDLQHVDISGNRQLKESDIDEALAGQAISPTITTLILNDMNITKTPSVIKGMRYLQSLQMDRCQITEIGQLPDSLKELSIKDHKVTDILGQLQLTTNNKLTSLDISGEINVSAGALTKWITKTSGSLTNKRYSGDRKLTNEMKEQIKRALPNLEKCRDQNNDDHQ
jgi:hypothetical protein